LLLPWFVFCVLLALPVHAAEISRVDLERAMAEQLGDHAAALRPLVEQLDARDLPLVILQQKLNEGQAKRVPAPRIAAALEQLATDLLWLDAQLLPCWKNTATSPRRPLLDITVDLLQGGVGREGLAEVLPEVCAEEQPRVRLARAADTYFYLRRTLGASPPQAWSFVAALLGRRASTAAVNQFVTVLQDIHRSAGSIDQPLQIATARLRAGGSLRSVRNALAEQYLRR